MASECNQDNRPAILAVVQGEWIDQAIDYFNKGNTTLYFFTKSGIKKAVSSKEIKYVYFKLKGNTYINFMADFVGCTETNPTPSRLPGSMGIDGEGKYYYGFKRPVRLKNNVDLTDLSYFTTGNNLRKDEPGARIIKDPMCR